MYLLLMVTLSLSVSMKLASEKYPHIASQLEIIQEYKPKITGGNEVNPNSIPYQAGLFFLGGDFFCGGALIADNWVLTSAHCGVLDNKPLVILGAHKINDTTETSQVRVIAESITVHPGYDPQTYANDLALVLLPAVTLTNAIQPVSLPSTSPPIPTYARTVGTISGWGQEYDWTEGMVNRLRAAQASILTNDQCIEDFTSEVPLTVGNICLDGEGIQGICNGDSGAPLTTTSTGKTILVGIGSFSSELGCNVGFPSVFSRITYFADWIQQITGVSG